MRADALQSAQAFYHVARQVGFRGRRRILTSRSRRFPIMSASLNVIRMSPLPAATARWR